MTQRPTIGSLRNSGIGILRNNSPIPRSVSSIGPLSLVLVSCLRAKMMGDKGRRTQDQLNVPHDLLEVRRWAGQAYGAFAWGAIAALLAFEQLHEELHRLVDQHAEPVKRNRAFDDLVNAHLKARRWHFLPVVQQACSLLGPGGGVDHQFPTGWLDEANP